MSLKCSIFFYLFRRWPDSLPGNDWLRSFRDRWKKRVKVRKPQNIKRSRAKVWFLVVKLGN